MNLGAEIGGERAKAAREAHRQRLQHGFLHALALIADALAEQHDDLDGDLGLALKEAQKVLATQHEQFRRLARGGIRRAVLAVEHGDLAKEIAGAHEVQRQPATIWRTRLDPYLAAPHPEQG